MKALEILVLISLILVVILAATAATGNPWATTALLVILAQGVTVAILAGLAAAMTAPRWPERSILIVLRRRIPGSSLPKDLELGSLPCSKAVSHSVKVLIEKADGLSEAEKVAAIRHAEEADDAVGGRLASFRCGAPETVLVIKAY